MRGAVSQAGTVDDQRVVQQGTAVRFLKFLHPLQEVGELLDVEDVDLLQCLVAVAVLVVGHAVMLHRLVENALVKQRGIAPFGPDHERADIRDPHLESQQHQVGLQLDIVTPPLGRISLVGTRISASEMSLRCLAILISTSRIASLQL